VLGTFVAAASLILAATALFFARRVYYHSPPWIDEKIEGVMSTFLEPDEEGKNIVDHLADRFGKGFRMSLIGAKGNETKHEKMIEKRVFDAAVEKSPELKIGMKVMEEFGLGDLMTPENMPALLKIANKYGLFGLMRGNSPGEPSHGPGVM